MHYALIPNLERVLNSASVKGKGEKRKSAPSNSFICYNCFTPFHRVSTLRAHVQWCHKESGQVWKLPDREERMTFQPGKREFEIGYVFFFDFETLQVAPPLCGDCGKEAAECKRKTCVETEHVAFAYSFVMVERGGKIVENYSYVGHDADTRFVDLLLAMNEKYTKKLNEVKPMELTPEDEDNFASASHCHICKQPFLTKPSPDAPEAAAEEDGSSEDELLAEEAIAEMEAASERDPGEIVLDDDEEPTKRKPPPNYSPKCKDHDHLLGHYIGAAHMDCNLHRREAKKIVGMAHCMSGYDSHIILKAMAKHRDCSKWNIKAIPINTEKFKVIRFNNLVIMDSLSFLNDSLDKLTATLVKSDHDFPIMKKWLPDKEKRDLMMRKGVYPYEYVTSMDKVVNTRSLPPKEAFYSRLSGSHITDGDYAHAKRVWDVFGCRNLADYTRLYCQADTIQLCEAVLNLRERVMATYGVDMCHYLSLPMMSKDIMLKFTNCEIDFIRDLEMLHLIRRNIRGGLSFIGHRHIDVDEETRRRCEALVLTYLDCNNLYGGSMRFRLPTGNYAWLTEKQIASLTMEHFSDDSPTGYILEVTMEYPESLHEDHSSFPLAPHHMEIDQERLSQYAKSALREAAGKPSYKATKLTSTFLPRVKYLIHGLNFRLCMEQGLKLIKIHRVIRFKQQPFLKPYIEECTRNRADSKSTSQANMYKLLW